MNKEFKEGDWVYEVYVGEGISLRPLEKYCGDNDGNYLKTKYPNLYYPDGRQYKGFKLPTLVHANEDTYNALVMLYGEANVPKPPPSRHDIIAELLKRQEAVLCKVSDLSYEYALNGDKYVAIVKCIEGHKRPYKAIDMGWKYAVAVDANGNEITGIRE